MSALSLKVRMSMFALDEISSRVEISSSQCDKLAEDILALLFLKITVMNYIVVGKQATYLRTGFHCCAMVNRLGSRIDQIDDSY